MMRRTAFDRLAPPAWPVIDFVEETGTVPVAAPIAIVVVVELPKCRVLDIVETRILHAWTTARAAQVSV